MNTRLFRQVSLARLSSPEQLDQIMRVTSSRQWIALLGIGVLLLAALIWGETGSLTTTASGTAVLVRTGGVVNVVSSGSGVIARLNVHVGDRIKANQVIGSVAQPVLAEKLKSLDQTIAETEQQGRESDNLRTTNARLQVDAMHRQRDNALRQISEIEDQRKIVTEQVAAEEGLQEKGLVTRQQVLAVRQRLVDLNDQTAALHVQIAQFDAQVSSIAMLPREGQADIRSRIDLLRRERAELEGELALASQITTPYSGEVLEMKADPGSMVSTGQALFSLQPEAKDLEALAYIPSSKAKDAKVGMTVQISPTIIKREEFGYMKGNVTSVSSFPATPAALMRNFANDQLVQSLLLAGPVTETHVRLTPDNATVSGFEWSTSKGPPVNLSSGTLCTVQVVTREQRPITLLFPYLKEKFGLG